MNSTNGTEKKEVIWGVYIGTIAMLIVLVGTVIQILSNGQEEQDMKTVSFRASDNFINKYNELLSLEQQEEYPLKKSEMFDEMINLYYAKKVLGDNTKILGEEIDRMMKDNLSMFSERIAVMVNSVHGVMDEINEKVSEK